MSNEEQLKKELTTTFDEFWNTWAHREDKAATIDKIIPFFHPCITAIGTGEHEKGKHYEEVIQNFASDFAQIETPLSIDYFDKKAKVLSPTSGLVEAEAFVEFNVDEEMTLKFHLRLTTVFVLENGKWVISHNHVSIPSDGQSYGEAYPVDKLRAKNEKLQSLVLERTESLRVKTLQLEAEKEKTESLLHNILPKSVAQELMDSGATKPAKFEEVSIIFTDFIGFTNIVSSMPSKRMIMELNDLFGHFDDIMDEEGIEKIKTIGDAYLSVAGLPQEMDDHAIRCVRAAQKIIDFLDKRNERSAIKWKIRIGIHSGPIVAGVVGKRKFAYDVFGDTINIASRIESAGIEGRINVSAYTYFLIKDHFECEYRGKVSAKGKGELDMYLVNTNQIFESNAAEPGPNH